MLIAPPNCMGTPLNMHTDNKSLKVLRYDSLIQGSFWPKLWINFCIISMQFENLVDGLIEGAADSFNFNDNSFLPNDAQTALDGFVNASVGNINISGT